MTESYSTRRGANSWLLRRGQPQRLGDLITVSKADRQGDIEASMTGAFRIGARHNGNRK